MSRFTFLKVSGPAIVAYTITGLMYWSGVLAPAQRFLTDFSWLTLQKPITSDIVLVQLDARTLREESTFPWPRHLHADVTRKVAEAGARRLFLYFDFSTESTLDGDKALEDVLKTEADGRVLLPAFRSYRASQGGLVSELVFPAPRFREHVTVVSTSVPLGSDALTREFLLSDPGHVTPVASAAAILNDWADPPAVALPLDFSVLPDSFQRLSYIDVLQGKFDPQIFKEKKVIIGATANKLGELVPVPMFRSLPAPLIHALAYESIRRGPLTVVPPWMIMAVCMLSALLLGMACNAVTWRWGLLLAVATIVVVFLGSLVGISHIRVIADLTPFYLVVPLSFFLTILAKLDQQTLRLWLQKIELTRKDVILGSIVNTSIDAIITINKNGGVEVSNPAAEQMFGYNPKALQDTNVAALIPGLSASLHMESSTHDETNNLHAQEMIGYQRDRETFPIEVSLSIANVDGQRLYTAIIRDITERKRQEEQLRYQATHDALTNLPNRFFLSQRIATATSCASTRRAALLVLDLDDFTQLNDTLGHDVGDEILKEIAERLLPMVPENATLARIGGDEFALFVVLDDHWSVVVDLIGCMQEQMERPFIAQGIALRIGLSIGISRYPHDGTTSLLQRADIALLEAKKARRGYQFYHSSFDKMSVRRLQMAGKLRSAIENNLIVVYYQPIVCLQTGQLHSVEALARWNDPDLGAVRPDEFISLAETSGLIRPLTIQTLKQSLAQQLQWQSHGHDFSLSVNISARVIQDAGFPEILSECLNEHPADPSRLILEITESALMSDPNRGLRTAQQINAMGVKLAIDDFGTGYSSLSYLQKLPVQELKIDKCFVTNIEQQESDRLITNSIVQLGRGLGLQTVAEGVETRASMEEVRQIGCDYAQGYWISWPMPPRSFSDWHQTWETETRPLLQLSTPTRLRRSAP